ncbi:MAG: CHASE2 domain-containing protein [Sedimenticola sp.]|nr:CHASE2 domain-containing protein [Sedimenticola sp.]
MSPSWLVLSLLLIGALLLALNSQLLWRMDQLLYDAQLKLWSRPPPQDVVIVAVDSGSLTQLGRWPWKRGIHAELIDRLSAEGARAIFLDILFVEPDQQHPEEDARLADAIARSNRVFLPVIIEQLMRDGQLTETLPMPLLAEKARGFGHVDIDLDPDGIARRVFLREGVGSAHWPSISVAILQAVSPEQVKTLPGGRNPDVISSGAAAIVRDHHILLPFAGPPGHFNSLPYAEVLSGTYPADYFRDKIVLVGATAPGLGDLIPTPVSGYNRPMSGVEINANLIDALRRGIAIETLDIKWQLQLTGLILFLSLLSFPFIKPRLLFLTVGVMFFSTLGISSLLLHSLQLWFPPTAILTGLLLGFPLWSWRRMVRTARYFEQELTRLREEPRNIQFYEASGHFSSGLNFLKEILQFDGWVLCDAMGLVINSSDRALVATPPGSLILLGQTRKEMWLWLLIPRGNTHWQLGLKMNEALYQDPDAMELLTEYIEQFGVNYRPERRGNVELVERQVRRVQSAIADLRSTRRLLSDILRQMVDGVLVINLGGQVVMSNKRAAHFLGIPVESDPVLFDMDVLSHHLSIKGGLTLGAVFRDVLVDGKVVSLEGSIAQQGEMLIQISPLSEAGGRFNGAIIILSDISPLKESERQRTQTLNFLSHDLRSPLTSLISMLEIQKSGVEVLTEVELSDRISRYAHKALRLADDFLRLAKAENADYENFRETDMVSLAHNAVDAVYAEAKSKTITLERIIQSENIWMKADATMLERALINLLENAIRYSPVGSKVTFRLASHEQDVSCCIEDQGQGIAKEDQEKIFAPYQQIRKGASKNQKGTGLGLAFVKVVVEKHRGKITVQSDVNVGASFCLTLPVISEA